MNLIIKKFSELSLDELYEIFRVRIAVFVVEQDCSYHELDDLDQTAYHFFYEENGKLLAFLRLLYQNLPEGQVKIGRVLTMQRGQGLGLKIMQDAIQFTKQNLNAEYIRVEAQVSARGFYEKLGFKQSSNEYKIDSIPHIEMIYQLND